MPHLEEIIRRNKLATNGGYKGERDTLAKAVRMLLAMPESHEAREQAQQALKELTE